jgi:hypothetical protein
MHRFVKKFKSDEKARRQRELDLQFMPPAMKRRNSISTSSTVTKKKKKKKKKKKESNGKGIRR